MHSLTASERITYALQRRHGLNATTCMQQTAEVIEEVADLDTLAAARDHKTLLKTRVDRLSEKQTALSEKVVEVEKTVKAENQTKQELTKKLKDTREMKEKYEKATRKRVEMIENVGKFITQMGST